MEKDHEGDDADTAGDWAVSKGRVQGSQGRKAGKSSKSKEGRKKTAKNARAAAFIALPSPIPAASSSNFISGGQTRNTANPSGTGTEVGLAERSGRGEDCVTSSKRARRSHSHGSEDNGY